jgi:endonuclease-3
VNRTERAAFAIEALRKEIPEPETELRYVDPFQLTVAVVLSAQCTDERVNKVTPELFRAFPTAEHLARVEPGEVFPYVRSISYPNNKSRHLVGLARRVVDDFGGQIPRNFQDLLSLPGVGRKTAQVIISVAFDEDALPVDTHIFRVANRIGLVKDANTPLKVERQLKRILPQAAWSEGHHLLILHGRYRCTARSPRCGDCPVLPACRYGTERNALPTPLRNLDAQRGKYYCATRRHYFDEPDVHTDRYGTPQISCPTCGSMNTFVTRTGETTKRVRDFRI